MNTITHSSRNHRIDACGQTNYAAFQVVDLANDLDRVDFLISRNADIESFRDAVEQLRDIEGRLVRARKHVWKASADLRSAIAALPKSANA